MTIDNKFGDTLLKWVAVLVFAFLVFVIAGTIWAYHNGAFAKLIIPPAAFGYNFVICLHGPTQTNNTYPEGTVCDTPAVKQDPYPENYYTKKGIPAELVEEKLEKEEQEVQQDEQDHEEESEVWDREGWTRLK